MEPHPAPDATTSDTAPSIRVVSTVPAPRASTPADAITVEITLPPGSAGSAPHRHPGPVYGYVIEGAVVFEIEGEPARVVAAGQSFWEPGGDLIHYQDANHLDDAPSRFVAVLFVPPGEPILTLASESELAERAHQRVSSSDPTTP